MHQLNGFYVLRQPVQIVGVSNNDVPGHAIREAAGNKAIKHLTTFLLPLWYKKFGQSNCPDSAWILPLSKRTKTAAGFVQLYKPQKIPQIGV
jgi:hypothetical protein